jgi:hypothetical protein
LNTRQKNTIKLSGQAWRCALLLAFFAWIAAPVFAQNTKGDKPASNGPLLRLPKIKSKHKGGDRPYTKDISGRKRIRTKNKSSVNRVIYQAPNPYADRRRSKTIPDRQGQAIGRIYNTPPRERQRAWRGSISGGPLRVRSVSAQRARNNVYTHTVSGQSVYRGRPSNQQRAWRGNLRGGKIGPASASSPFLTRGRKNVYWGKFSKGEKPITHDLTGRPLYRRNFRSPGVGVGVSDTLKLAGKKPGRERAKAGSGTGGILKSSRRGERAWNGDVSGRPIRQRSARHGETGGIYIFTFKRSASGRGETAGSALHGGGFRSASRTPGNGRLPARAPGVGASGIARVLRKLTGQRTPKGGGSATGKYLNNNGRPVDVRAPGIGSQGMGGFQGRVRKGDLSPGFTKQGIGYSGNIKARRPLRGGGSISGRYLGNNGRPIDVRAPGIGSQGMGGFQGRFRKGDLSPGFTKQGIGYSGNMKARRPLKGGGSISGKYLGNNGRPIDVRAPGIGSQGIGGFKGRFRKGDLSPGFTKQGIGYSGNIKTRRPLKGGGTVSGRVWNNDHQPIQVRLGAPGFDRAARFRGNQLKDEVIPEFGSQGYGFSGRSKARKPKHGGGTVSGKVFNNNGQPIEVRAPGSEGGSVARFSGNMKAKKPKKGGESISGRIWNNNGKPIEVRLPGSAEAKAANYSGKTRLSGFKRNYIQNPKASAESLKKRKPAPNTYLADGLFVNNKQETYRRKPSASDNAMLGIGPKKGTVQASEYSRAMKMTWSYKHNPSSNGNALKVIAPGKAYARINDYQGNVKMRKYTDGRMHPDAQFAHGNRDNVKEDRTFMMNLKLLWAKLFKKNELQPENVKEKEHRPRYDKKETELWKALYD